MQAEEAEKAAKSLRFAASEHMRQGLDQQMEERLHIREEQQASSSLAESFQLSDNKALILIIMFFTMWELAFLMQVTPGPVCMWLHGTHA